MGVAFHNFSVPYNAEWKKNNGGFQCKSIDNIILMIFWAIHLDIDYIYIQFRENGLLMKERIWVRPFDEFVRNFDFTTKCFEEYGCGINVRDNKKKNTLLSNWIKTILHASKFYDSYT